MSRRPPVIDWSTDFDHLDPRWTENPYPIWDELRQKCRIAHTERFMGAYFATRYEDVRTIAYDTEHFSSRRPVVRETRPPLTPAPPITSDPPEHGPAKNVLLPVFTPEAINRHAPRTRDVCQELIGPIAAKKSCDAAVEYAQEIPVRVIAHMARRLSETRPIICRQAVDLTISQLCGDGAHSAVNVIATLPGREHF